MIKMTSSIDAFLKKFKQHQQMSLEASAKIINTTLLEMYKKIIDRTPVGNPAIWNWPAPKGYNPGTLKKSWKISFNGNIRDTDGKFTSATQLSNNYGLSFKVGTNKQQTATIFNPQPYAQRVETGWSTQAPQGMMRITIAEYVGILDKNAAKYRIK